MNTKKLQPLADSLKALAHPVRIGIIKLLKPGSKLCVTEIHTSLKLDQAPVSHHLNILKNKGILKCERKGHKCYYSLKQAQLHELIQCMEACEAS